MEFEEYVDLVEDNLCTLGNVQTKSINYGVQFVVSGIGKKVTLNVYNGKKGISLVWGGGDSDLQAQAIEAVRKIRLKEDNVMSAGAASETKEAKVKTTAVRRFDVQAASADGVHLSASQTRMLLAQEAGFPGVWMGSDESGKGDYFGPLVVAAVCLDVKGGEALLAAGVKDCKSLSDEKVLALSAVIEKTALATSVLIMKPHIYNMRYEQVQQKGGNLNTLLALGHIAALKQAWQKYPDCHWAIVDQFAKNESIPDGVHAFAPQMQVWQRPRAEEDIAVAAASVLARGAFLQTIRMLAHEAEIGRIPKGGGEAATNAARRLAQKKGTEALRQYVKLHFANTQKL